MKNVEALSQYREFIKNTGHHLSTINFNLHYPSPTSATTKTPKTTTFSWWPPLKFRWPSLIIWWPRGKNWWLYGDRGRYYSSVSWRVTRLNFPLRSFSTSCSLRKLSKALLNTRSPDRYEWVALCKVLRLSG